MLGVIDKSVLYKHILAFVSVITHNNPTRKNSLATLHDNSTKTSIVELLYSIQSYYFLRHSVTGHSEKADGYISLICISEESSLFVYV